MIIKLGKIIIWLIFLILIWSKEGFIPAFLCLIITIIADFVALYWCFQLAVAGYREGKSEEDRREAIYRVAEYQRNPMYPSTPLVDFAQMILSPICSLSIPFIIGGFFLGWYFNFAEWYYNFLGWYFQFF